MATQSETVGGALRTHARPKAPTRVSPPTSRHEHEADHAAGIVARGGSVVGWSFSEVSRSAQRNETKPKSDDEQAPVQRTAASSAPAPLHADVEDVLATAGRPLDPGTREFMEARFGFDFSQVRIHDDSRAAETAARIDAAAFTVGRHVAFGAGRYAPSTSEGRRLLAHELAHSVQQHGATANAPALAPGCDLERRAADAGRAVAAGRPVSGPLGTSGLAVAREVIGNENQWVPEQLTPDERVAFDRIWPLLRKRSDYAGRSRDVMILEALKARAQKRITERKAVADEAEAAVARSNAEDAEETRREAENDARSVPGAPKQRKAPTSQFAPGGFDYDAYMQEHYEAPKRRLDESLAPAKDPRRFADRVKEAKAKAPPTLLPADFADSVWRYGRQHGLFAEYEERIVKDAVDERRLERGRQEGKRQKMEAERQRDLRHKQAIQNIQLAPFQAPAVAAFGKVAAAAYLVYTGFDVTIQTHRAVQSGSTTDVIGTLLPIATGALVYRIVGSPPRGGRGGGAGTGTPQRAGGSTGRPVELSPSDVRTAVATDPNLVKVMASNSWAQFIWEQHGGQGIHPLAWRHPSGRVMFVNEQRWLAVGELSEIAQPHQLTTPRGPLPQRGVPVPGAFEPTFVDPRAPTVAAPSGGGTQPSVPRVRPVPQGGRLRPRPVAITPEEAVRAYETNPRQVHGSVSSDWHAQAWAMDGGRGAPPLAFRVGTQVFVDAARLSTALRAQLGLLMRLP